jgi:hypothetical protein
MISPDSFPRHWDLLSIADRACYTELRLSFSDPARKGHRGRNWQTFTDCLALVRSFVVQHTPDDWRRAVVSGIYWFPDNTTVAVNIRQLGLLIAKCKSSINGAFQHLGFGIPRTGGDPVAELRRNLPFFSDNFGELKQWTIRQQPTKVEPQVLSPAPTIETHNQFTNFSLETEAVPGFDRDYEPVGGFGPMPPDLFEEAAPFVPSEAELKDWDSSPEFAVRDWRELKLPDFTL